MSVPEVLDQLRAQLETAAKALVRDESSIHVELLVSSAGPVALLVIHAAPSDVGRLVGRRGATVRALRHRVSERAGAVGWRVVLVIGPGSRPVSPESGA